MPTSTQELQSFQQYATARIQNGGAMLELDELLEEWKDHNTAQSVVNAKSSSIVYGSFPTITSRDAENSLEAKRQQARAEVLLSLERQGAKPIEDPSVLVRRIAPEGETAEDFLLAVGRSQDNSDRRDFLNG